MLISPPRRWMHFLFRFQTYLISGATIAIIFPVLNTRHLPFEVASYYIHHALMLVTPLYLMRLGGKKLFLSLFTIYSHKFWLLKMFQKWKRSTVLGIPKIKYSPNLLVYQLNIWAFRDSVQLFKSHLSFSSINQIFINKIFISR